MTDITYGSNRCLVDVDSLGPLFTDRVARVSELIALGMTSDHVYRRCRPGGPWQRLLPGVLLLTNATPTREQVVRAALRFTEPKSILSGLDALQLHGLRTPPCEGPVHILIPSGRQVRSDPLVRVERTTRLPRPQHRNNFPVAPVTRAVLDTTRRLTAIDQARALIAEAVQRRQTTAEALHAELRLGSNRGTATPRKVLTEISDGVRSAAEAWGRRLIQASDLPAPRWNMRIRNEHGEQLAIVDAWWDDVGLAWEIDSYEFHLSPGDYAATLKRGASLTAAGLVVIHTVPGRIRREPRAVLAELRQAHEHAKSRPRPTVTAEPGG